MGNLMIKTTMAFNHNDTLVNWSVDGLVADNVTS